MIKMLAFDLDGTLLDTIKDIGYAMNFALKTYGLKERLEEEFPSFIGGGIYELVKRAINQEVSEEVRNKVRELYLARYDETKMNITKPFENVVEVLKTLKSKGYKLCVISNKNHNQSVDLVSHYFPGLFDYVAGQKNDVRLKPDTEAMEIMAHNFGLSFDEICYFGDSKTDGLFSENCGCKYFLFEHGYETKEVLHSFKPIKFLKNAKEILEYF